MPDKEIGVHFGFLADSLDKQLKKQGFNFDPATAQEYESYRRAILTLDLGDIINDKTRTMAQKKLFTKIKAHVKKKNKLKQA